MTVGSGGRCSPCRPATSRRRTTAPLRHRAVCLRQRESSADDRGRSGAAASRRRDELVARLGIARLRPSTARARPRPPPPRHRAAGASRRGSCTHRGSSTGRPAGAPVDPPDSREELGAEQLGHPVRQLGHVAKRLDLLDERHHLRDRVDRQMTMTCVRGSPDRGDVPVEPAPMAQVDREVGQLSEQAVVGRCSSKKRMAPAAGPCGLLPRRRVSVPARQTARGPWPRPRRRRDTGLHVHHRVPVHRRRRDGPNTDRRPSPRRRASCRCGR